MRNPRPAPSHAPTIQRRPEPAAADLAPADSIPPEHRIDPVIRLEPAAMARVEELIANPPEPTEHLRRLMAGSPREIHVGADANGSPPAGAFERVIAGACVAHSEQSPGSNWDSAAAAPFEGGKPVHVVATPPAPWWNGIARAWMVAGPDGAPVRLDPQPAAPRMVLADPASPFRPEPGFNGPRAVVSFVPPAVKVSA